MTKRIIVYVLTAILLLAFFTIILTIQATTNVIGNRQEAQAKELLNVIYGVYREYGSQLTEGYSTDSYTVSLFTADPDTIDDEVREKWGEDADDEVIREFFDSAMASPGTVVSTNTSFLLGNVTMAGVCTDDGRIIAVFSSLNTFIGTLSDMRMELLYIMLVSILLATFLARLISYLIVQPINEIDIEAPTEEDSSRYKEIMPLINKIAEQREDLKKQEKKLEEGEGRLTTISETIVEGMVLIEADNTISYMNHAARKFVTLSDSEPIGKDYHTLFTEEMTKITDDTFSGGNQTTVLYVENKAYQIETTHVVLPGGDYNGVAIIIYDITDRMNLERDRREFTANVSHELKTPLHIIAGSAELLELGIVQNEEDRKNFLHQIMTETEHMTKLVNNILKLSKFDAKQTKKAVDQEIISVKEKTLSVIERLKSVAADKDIEIFLNGDDVSVKCNDMMLDQIIFNLVENAVKYTNNGGRVVVTTQRTENGGTIIDVKDNGIGIPKESQDKVFDRFYRVDKSRSREVGGTGLGLSIVQNACIENGADIKIESSIPGVGTTFRVTFPPVDESNGTETVS